MKAVINYKKLKKYRHMLGLTGPQVANIVSKELGEKIHPNSIYNWEKGQRPQKKYRKVLREYIKRIEQIAKARGIDELPKGNPGYKWTPEQRAKLSASMKKAHKVKPKWTKNSQKGIKRGPYKKRIDKRLDHLKKTTGKTIRYTCQDAIKVKLFGIPILTIRKYKREV